MWMHTFELCAASRRSVSAGLPSNSKSPLGIFCCLIDAGLPQVAGRYLLLSHHCGSAAGLLSHRCGGLPSSSKSPVGIFCCLRARYLLLSHRCGAVGIFCCLIIAGLLSFEYPRHCRSAFEQAVFCCLIDAGLPSSSKPPVGIFCCLVLPLSSKSPLRILCCLIDAGLPSSSKSPLGIVSSLRVCL